MIGVQQPRANGSLLRFYAIGLLPESVCSKRGMLLFSMQQEGTCNNWVFRDRFNFLSGLSALQIFLL